MLQGGEEDEPLIRRGGGEKLYQQMLMINVLSFFLLDHTNYFEWFSDWLFLRLKFLRIAVAFLYFFVMRMRSWHLNIGL